MAANMNRNVCEGWTPVDFIRELQPTLDLIMQGNSYIRPFTTKKDMTKWIVDNQPYYKKPISEVNSYFAKRYGLK